MPLNNPLSSNNKNYKKDLNNKMIKDLQVFKGPVFVQVKEDIM